MHRTTSQSPAPRQKSRGTAPAVPQMQRLVESFRSKGALIVHVVRLNRLDGSNVDQCRREDVESGAEIVRPETDGAELVEELKPLADVQLEADQLPAGGFQQNGPQEWTMYRPRWGTFYSTNLDDFLAERSVTTLVVCSCNFPNCPRTTSHEASERDYRIGFVPDAMLGTYQTGLDQLENIGVAVMDALLANEWITELTPSCPAKRAELLL